MHVASLLLHTLQDMHSLAEAASDGVANSPQELKS